VIDAYGSNVIVEIQVAKGGGVSTGGIYLPEGTSTGNQIASGVVISVGPKVGVDTLALASVVDVVPKVGDTLWFPKFNSTELEYEGKKYNIVTDNAILAVNRK
jgi:co-chaperonin GroES (HSP10)